MRIRWPWQTGRRGVPGLASRGLVPGGIGLCLWLCIVASATAQAGPVGEDLFDEYEARSGATRVADPLYRLNYGIYRFNDILYFRVMEPLARGYRAVTPRVFRQGIDNFFHHILFPVRLVNTLVQGKPRSAGRECEIFLINTMGSLGFSRIAQDVHGLADADEDLGQSLGHHGVGHGIYLVLPLLGPSTLRDLAGRVGDYFLDPLTHIDAARVTTGMMVLDTVNGTALRLGDYAAIKEAAFDPYIALKDGYLQFREKQVRQ